MSAPQQQQQPGASRESFDLDKFLGNINNGQQQQQQQQPPPHHQQQQSGGPAPGPAGVPPAAPGGPQQTKENVNSWLNGTNVPPGAAASAIKSGGGVPMVSVTGTNDVPMRDSITETQKALLAEEMKTLTNNLNQKNLFMDSNSLSPYGVADTESHSVSSYGEDAASDFGDLGTYGMDTFNFNDDMGAFGMDLATANMPRQGANTAGGLLSVGGDMPRTASMGDLPQHRAQPLPGFGAGAPSGLGTLGGGVVPGSTGPGFGGGGGGGGGNFGGGLAPPGVPRMPVVRRRRKRVSLPPNAHHYHNRKPVKERGEKGAKFVPAEPIVDGEHLTEKMILDQTIIEERDGVKNWICPVQGCGRHFTTANGLRYHAINGHTKAAAKKRPYKCPVIECGARYCTNRGLQEHMEKKHPTMDIPNIMARINEEVRRLYGIQPLKPKGKRKGKRRGSDGSQHSHTHSHLSPAGSPYAPASPALSSSPPAGTDQTKFLSPHHTHNFMG
eukprot:Clim_evm47s157 gene=Clim_evmTU47s157